MENNDIMNYITNYAKIDTTNDTIDDTKNTEIYGIVFIIIFFIWIIIGFIAFITSLICFARNGTITDKIVGLLLALFFGPFYFLFYAFKKDYCTKV
jgi:hypothetical protein